MEVNVYFNGPATEIDMGPREFSVIPATGPAGADGQPGRDGTIENLDVAATTLPAGSQATASYENNLLTLGIPQGDAGRGIVSITKQSSSGLVDTYKITYTSGASSTFTVTNGQDTSAISVNRSGVTQGWTSSTWSSYAQNAGAPSGGTCYYEILTVDGATKYDTFVPRYMLNFTGVVYVTVLDGQIRVETSVNVIGQYWINGAIIRGSNNTQNNTTVYHPGGGGGTWGNITGTLSNQTDLQNALNGKLDTSKVYNGLDQTSSGYALDARQGKALSDAIPTKTSNLTNDSGFITGLISGTTAWYLPAYSLSSFSGKALTNILNDWAVNVPTGYSLLANVEVSIGGAVGLTCHFDGANEHLKIKPNIYIYNAKNTTVSVSNDQTAISVISLFIKN